MKNTIAMVCLLLFVGCSLPSKTNVTTLDVAWVQLKIQTNRRQQNMLTDEEFLIWYETNLLCGSLSRDQLESNMLGFPEIIYDDEKGQLIPDAHSGEWREPIKESFGAWHEEVEKKWSEEKRLKMLDRAIQRKCILVTRLCSYIVKDKNKQKKRFSMDVMLKYWLFIYGEEVLLYPYTAELFDTLARRPYQRPWPWAQFN